MPNKKLSTQYLNSNLTSGRYYDDSGTGLHIYVRKSGSKSWSQKIRFKGKQAICELTGKTTYDRKVGYCSIDGKPFEEIMVENSSCEYWCKYDVWGRYC